MNAFVRIAYKATAKSTHPQHEMAAVVIRGGSVVSVAANLHAWGHCAERRALKKHNNYSGATLIVVRANGGCSKPCKRCVKIIKEANIKYIGYVNEQGQFVVEKA